MATETITPMQPTAMWSSLGVWLVMRGTEFAAVGGGWTTARDEAREWVDGTEAKKFAAQR